MIELSHDTLVFSFPEVHPQARISISFQRTLRIPDDGRDHFLPPGLGNFPLRHVDDFAAGVPRSWLERGGVLLPMYQSEAMWISFRPDFVEQHDAEYPFAIKIAAGKVNVATGEPWASSLTQSPQDYMVAPVQPWVDGYCVEKGIIRQFVAMPLGAGYSAEEQLSGKAEYGGLQIQVCPMKREEFERRFPKVAKGRRSSRFAGNMECCCMEVGMGLAPGGRMKQEIYSDPYGLDEWEQSRSSRCFVHLANSLVWRAITRENPPTVPLTAIEYVRAGLPWFDYYSDSQTPLEGSKALNGLKSVKEMGEQKGDVPLPENESVDPKHVVTIKEHPGRVREGAF